MKKLAFASSTLLLLTFILSLSQTGCQKSDPVTTDSTSQCKHTVEGFWTGTTVNTAGDGQAWSVSIKPDGTASYENTIHNTGQLAVGTWTLKNDTLTVNTVLLYGYSVFLGAAQTFTAKYDSTTGILTNGTYVTLAPGTDAGTFTLTEVNNKCTPAIEGLWTGTTINTAGDGQGWSVAIKTDGTAAYENIIHDTHQLAVGSWTLKHDTLTVNTVLSYGYSVFLGAAQTFTAKYDSTTGTLTNGTYVTLAPGTDAGTFTLTAVK
jgi:hypothetical protein